MAKTQKRPKRQRLQMRKQPDSVYFLKIVMFFIIGGVWVFFDDSAVPGIPIGLILGLFFASKDHFQLDRKIEYAILLSAAILSFVAPIGLVLQFSGSHLPF
jgi:ABC-type dipeptide/oligopeptide/nickel transport system permease component